MNIKKNDTVIVLSGKDKGKKGKVMTAMPKDNDKVIVEGVNIASCHVKARKKQGEEGGIIRKEIPLRADKVMLICPKCGKPTRVRTSWSSARKGKESTSASAKSAAQKSLREEGEKNNG
jgi:large subunit ribosomal protein L24